MTQNDGPGKNDEGGGGAAQGIRRDPSGILISQRGPKEEMAVTSDVVDSSTAWGKVLAFSMPEVMDRLTALVRTLVKTMTTGRKLVGVC
jgi:hypothetical protein